MRRPIVFALTIAAIATLTLFQNCAPTQNFDLEQAPQASLNGEDALPAPVLPEPAAPAAPPMEEEVEPTPEWPATAGVYCPADRQPQVKVAVINMDGANLLSASLSGLRNSGTELSELTIYLKKPNYGKVSAAALMSIGASPILAAGGSLLDRNFMLEFTGHLQLSPGALSGDYQLVARHSGYLNVNLDNMDVLSKKSDLEGVHVTCGAKLSGLRVADQLPFVIRQVHGVANDAQLELFLRPATGDLSKCGDDMGSWVALNDGNFVLEKDGENLVKNGSFEDDAAIPSASAYHYPGGLKNWTSTGGMERWSSNMHGLLSSHGSHYIELDKDTASSRDAIYQILSGLHVGQKYRYLSEHALRPEQGSVETNQVEVRVGTRAGTSANFNRTVLETVVGAGNKRWKGYSYIVTPSVSELEISFAEPSSRNDSIGGMIDNIVFRKIADSSGKCR